MALNKCTIKQNDFSVQNHNTLGIGSIVVSTAAFQNDHTLEAEKKLIQMWEMYKPIWMR